MYCTHTLLGKLTVREKLAHIHLYIIKLMYSKKLERSGLDLHLHKQLGHYVLQTSLTGKLSTLAERLKLRNAELHMVMCTYRLCSTSCICTHTHTHEPAGNQCAVAEKLEVTTTELHINSDRLVSIRHAHFSQQTFQWLPCMSCTVLRPALTDPLLPVGGCHACLAQCCSPEWSSMGEMLHQKFWTWPCAVV